jgi:hypothetical protein
MGTAQQVARPPATRDWRAGFYHAASFDAAPLDERCDSFGVMPHSEPCLFREPTDSTMQERRRVVIHASLLRCYANSKSNTGYLGAAPARSSCGEYPELF